MSKRRWLLVGYAATIVGAAALFGILVAAGVAPGLAGFIAVFEVLAVWCFAIAALWFAVARRAHGRERWVGVLLAVPRLLQGVAFAFAVVLGRWGFVVLFGAGIVLDWVDRRIARRLLGPEEVSGTGGA